LCGESVHGEAGPAWSDVEHGPDINDHADSSQTALADDGVCSAIYRTAHSRGQESVCNDTDIASLQAEVTSLKSTSAALQAEKETLMTDMTTLQIEHAALHNKHAAL
jgi:hypothetical protein